MTTSEFSNTFDTLLNSYNNQANFGEGASRQEIVLDEYEKSVFLTQAQDIIVKSYFDKTLNQQGQGLDDSSRRQVDFSSLIMVGEASVVTDSTKTTYDSRGKLFKCPSNVLVVLNEKLEVHTKDTTDTDGKKVEGKLKSLSVVVPINYREYDRYMSKAYTQPLKKQSWRLFQTGNSSVDIISEIIPIEGTIGADDVLKYKLRYIKRPKPIVLQDFSSDSIDNLDIDGVNTVSGCELNPIIHMDILNKAVELAVLYKGGGHQTTAGQQPK